MEDDLTDQLKLFETERMLEPGPASIAGPSKFDREREIQPEDKDSNHNSSGDLTLNVDDEGFLVDEDGMITG